MSKRIHVGKFSFYWCDYLKTQTTEYWSGFNRKRIFKLGKVTVWMQS